MTKNNAAYRRIRTLLVSIAVTSLAAGCAAPPAKDGPKEPPPAVAPAPPIPEPPKPPPPPAPKLDPKEAERLTKEAIDLLDKGEEGAAQANLEKARALNPANEDARVLLEQITTDPEALLGTQSSPYTIQPGDMLSKIAQANYGNRLLFWSLAKYNKIAQPNRVAAGQVIRIPRKPGTKPPPPSPPPPQPPQPPQSPQPPQPAQLQPPIPEPGPPRRDPQAQQCERDARRAELNQDLAAAISSWDCVLSREPNNEMARERRKTLQEALDKLKGR